MSEPVELKTLVYDNTSGAREIAQRTLQLLQVHATQSSVPTGPELLDELATVGTKVARSKPEMAPVLNALNRFLLEAEAQAAEDVGAQRIAVLSLLQDHLRRQETTLAATAQAGAALIQNGDVVLTYSRSSTVLETLRVAKKQGKLFDVVTAESRPNLEGRELAKELAADQIPVRFVVDALLGTAVEGADRILLGCDAITPTSVVNKAGTRLLSLAARDHKVPIHIAADFGKAWVKKADPSLSLLAGKLRDPKEVWDHSPYGVEILNLYFDLTPLDRFAGVATEDGVLSPTDYWAHVRQRGYAQRLQRAFHDELV